MKTNSTDPFPLLSPSPLVLSYHPAPLSPPLISPPPPSLLPPFLLLLPLPRQTDGQREREMGEREIRHSLDTNTE